MRTFFTDSEKSQVFVDHLYQEYDNVFVYFHTCGTHFCYYDKSSVLSAFRALHLGDVFIIEYERNDKLCQKYYMLDTHVLRPISHSLFDRYCNYAR